jgi:hypothetical protein
MRALGPRGGMRPPQRAGARGPLFFQRGRLPCQLALGRVQAWRRPLVVSKAAGEGGAGLWSPQGGAPVLQVQVSNGRDSGAGVWVVQGAARSAATAETRRP